MRLAPQYEVRWLRSPRQSKRDARDAKQIGLQAVENKRSREIWRGTAGRVQPVSAVNASSAVTRKAAPFPAAAGALSRHDPNAKSKAAVIRLASPWKHGIPRDETAEHARSRFIFRGKQHSVQPLPAGSSFGTRGYAPRSSALVLRRPRRGKGGAGDAKQIGLQAVENKRSREIWRGSGWSKRGQRWSASSTFVEARPSTGSPARCWKSAIAALVLAPIAPSGFPTS